MSAPTGQTELLTVDDDPPIAEMPVYCPGRDRALKRLGCDGQDRP